MAAQPVNGVLHFAFSVGSVKDFPSRQDEDTRSEAPKKTAAQRKSRCPRFQIAPVVVAMRHLSIICGEPRSLETRN